MSRAALSDRPVEDEHLEGEHLVVACQLSHDSFNAIPCFTLLDDGATGFAFMDEAFAHRYQFPLIPLKKPCDLEVIDGRLVVSGQITHIVRAKLQIRNHVEEAFFFITKLGHYPLVIGIPWWRHHDISIRYSKNKVTFVLDLCCRKHNAHGRPTCIEGLEKVTERAHKMAFIGSAALLHLRRKRGLRIFSATLCKIDTAAKVVEISCSLQAAGAALNKDPRFLVPEHFHDFLHVFEKGKAQELPPHRSYDHAIPLKPDTTPPFGPLYGMSYKEHLVLKEYIEEMWPRDLSHTPPLPPVLLSFS